MDDDSVMDGISGGTVIRRAALDRRGRAEKDNQKGRCMWLCGLTRGQTLRERVCYE